MTKQKRDKQNTRSKERLTITLPKDLLQQIDHTVDKHTIRNRSHAIETLVRKSLTPAIRTAIILAGGKKKGKTIPPLVKIIDRDLIYTTISHLKKFDITNFIIAAGTNQKRIKKVVGNGKNLDVKITFVPETTPLGTAGILKKIENRLKEPFLVVHGDVLTNVNIKELINFHNSENTLVTVAVKPRNAEQKYGKVNLQGNRITEFIDTKKSSGISIVNTGIYLLEPEVLSLIGNQTPTYLESEIFPRLATMKELTAFLFQGIWFDISTPENLKKARIRWKQEGR